MGSIADASIMLTVGKTEARKDAEFPGACHDSRERDGDQVETGTSSRQPDLLLEG